MYEGGKEVKENGKGAVCWNKEEEEMSKRGRE